MAEDKGMTYVLADIERLENLIRPGHTWLYSTLVFSIYARFISTDLLGKNCE